MRTAENYKQAPKFNTNYVKLNMHLAIFSRFSDKRVSQHMERILQKVT